jgi:hypothetical protein
MILETVLMVIGSLTAVSVSLSALMPVRSGSAV